MTPVIRKKDPCPCSSGRQYKDCCLKKEKRRNRDFHSDSLEAVRDIEIPGDIQIDSDDSGEISSKNSFESPVEELWNPTIVSAMTTEEIIKKLECMNVHFDKDQFLRQARGYVSACQLADDHYYTQNWKGDTDEDFIWLAICELWKRFIPHQSSAELIDEAIYNGYEFFYSGEYVNTCSEWRKAWDMIKKIMPSDITDATIIPKSIPISYDLSEWVEFYCEVLAHEGFEDSSYLHERITFVREFMDTFPDTDSLVQYLLLTECESYALLKNIEQAELLFQSFIEKYPENPRAYAIWGTMYWVYNDAGPDYEKALEIYRRGLARCIHNKRMILDQLKKMKKQRKLSSK